MFRSKKSKNKFSTAAIIGSGISGIACAIRLSQLGFKVEVFEGNKHAGGKISEIEKDGFRFDSGPSLLTLPQLIDELFYCCNKNPREYFNYNKLEIICKYFYNDGATLKAFSSPVKFADEAERVTGEPSKKILRYLKKSKKLFDVVEPVFLQRSLHKRSTYFVKPAWNAFINLYKLDSGSTLHNRNKTEFSSPKIVQLFDRYATYNGSDPFLAPATLKVIPHLEFNLGAYFPVNGMRSIITSLQELAEQSGVTFYFNSVVEEIIVSNNSATGIKFRNSEGASIEKFDVVVSNMDVVNTYRKLLPEKNNINQIEKQPRSTSALVFYWGIKKEFSELELHNILFSSDYKREFEFLTHKKEIYNDPTIYINISSKEKKDDAPAGCENWFVMINTPHIAGQNWDQLIQQARKDIVKKISAALNIDLESLIVSEMILDPRDIESQTSSYLGSLYGSSSNNRFAAFLRHKNFSSAIENLYFCGGSVHPGGGIPLCLMSAKIVAEMISKKKN